MVLEYVSFQPIAPSAFTIYTLRSSVPCELLVCLLSARMYARTLPMFRHVLDEDIASVFRVCYACVRSYAWVFGIRHRCWAQLACVSFSQTIYMTDRQPLDRFGVQ